MKELKMASKNQTTVDTRSELAELVKRKAEIAVWFRYGHAINIVSENDCHELESTQDFRKHLTKLELIRLPLDYVHNST
jgi:hypothetical protein